MGYARYVGRVGALAVALGVGAAVASAPGVAWAEEAGDGPPPADSAPADTGSTTAVVGQDDGTGDAAKPGTNPAGITTTTTTTTNGHQGTTVIGGDGAPTVTISGTTIDNSTPTGELGEPSTEPTPAASAEPEEPPSASPSSAAPPTPAAMRSNSEASALQNADAVRASAVAKTAPLDSENAPGALPIALRSAEVGGEDVPDTTQSIFEAGRGLTAGEVAELATPAVPNPIETLLAIPGTVISQVLNTVTAIFAPIIGPGAPVENPMLWGLLAWVRREFNRTFANSTPILNLQTTGQQDLNDGEIHGWLGGSDPDGDPLTYSVTAEPANGELSIDAATGTWTYKPDTGFGGTDTFTITASDAGSGPHIHALGQTHRTSDSITVTVTAGPPLTSVAEVGDQPFFVALSPDGSRAYVTNTGDLSGNGTVSVIDTATNTEIGVIEVGGVPVGVAVSPDGAKVYVTNIGDGTAPGEVSVIDTATNTAVATIGVGNAPGSVAFTPDGKRAYVTNAGSASVSVIDTASDTVIDTITDLGAPPGMVVVHPDGSRAYVTLDNNTVAVIDTANNAVLAEITGVGDGPASIAISGDGTRAYTGNNRDDSVSVIDTATNTVIATITDGINLPVAVAVSTDGTRLYVTNGYGAVSAFDTATNARITTLRTGPVAPSGAFGLAVNDDGTRVYVANPTTGTLTVVNTARIPAEAPIPVGGFPIDVAISPDGTRAYAVNNDDDTVSVVDLVNRTVVATIAVGDSPRSVALNPGGTRAYVTNYEDDTVTVIDTNTNTVVTTVPLTADFVRPIGVAVSPDGSYAYVALNEIDGGYVGIEVIDLNTNTSVDVILFTFDAQAASAHAIAFSANGDRAFVTSDIGGFIGPQAPQYVAVIDTVTRTVIADNPNGGGTGVAVMPDGSRAYIVEPRDDAVKVYDLDTNTVEQILEVEGASDVVLSLDGSRAYVTSADGTVVVIDTATDTVLATLPVGNNPGGIAISADGTRLLVVNNFDDTMSVIDL